jgi:N-acetylglutamate synthase-like GNAT family acetyltransferase
LYNNSKRSQKEVRTTALSWTRKKPRAPHADRWGTELMSNDMVSYAFLPNTIDKNSVDSIHTLLKDTYWASERTREEVEISLSNSVTIVARYLNDDIIGCARAITDKVAFSWICDVVVASSHRGKGFGKKLVEFLLAHADVAKTRKILVTKDAQSLYSKLGFKTHKYECMVNFTGHIEPQQASSQGFGG